MRKYARRLGVGAATVRRAIANFGVKSRVIVERPLRTASIRAKHLDCYQMLVNALKSPSAGRVAIFSDEKA